MAQPEKLYTSEVVFKFLQDVTTDPTPADPTAMHVDGSTVPKFFDLVAVNDLYLAKGSLMLLDANQAPTLFGGLPALTNGLLVEILDDQLVTALNYTDPITIKKNANWSYITGIDHAPISGQNIEEFNATFILANEGALYLPLGYRLRVTVQDDLSALDEMRIAITGQT